ncbi:MAG: hypothetical protein ACK5L6_03935 [Anaerorhabdus sp.]|uniref:hypothetical protein n=1 Tax=Anaerorhabdus sp. TaxID=1872524 RepID=UPI003A8B73A8
MIPSKTYSSPKMNVYEIPNPGGGGLNLQDLEFKCLSNQSPSMLNMMRKNGAFGKRWGQMVKHEIVDNIISTGFFDGFTYLHAGTKLLSYNKELNEVKEVYTELTEKPGIFINFNKFLYYLNGEKYIQYDGKECKVVEPYVPDICINRKPDGTYSDLIENYNRIGKGFKNTFNGDAAAKVYVLTDKELDETPIKVEIGTKEVTTGFTVDYKEGKVTFTTAPEKGQNNVVITAYKTEQKYIDSIMGCKYSANFGGANNSRLFLAGNGNATYYYSDVFDASYFPESNFAILGNGENDITGFGDQYSVLIIFKATETYGITYYLDNEQKGRFASSVINAHMGCDVPKSIQLLDNKLTWMNTIYGVCTMVSTALEDERNIQLVSRNINGGYRKSGLLQEANLSKAETVVYQGKYIISVNNNAYVWDFLNTPYVFNKNPDQDALVIAWYLWNNFGCKNFVIDDKDLFYTKDNKIVTIQELHNDFGEAIESYYQTPYMQFGSYEMLKTVKNMYVEVRGDTPSRIKVKYITEENPQGEEESEDIAVYTRLWKNFSWRTFGWTVITVAKTFARKCSIKKVQMLSVLFSNNETNTDMSISGIKFKYTIVKAIK